MNYTAVMWGWGQQGGGSKAHWTGMGKARCPTRTAAETRPGWATENVDRWKCRPQRCMQSERSRQFSLDSNRECATLSLNMHQLCKIISRPTNKDLSQRRKLPSPTLQSNSSTVWLIWNKLKCEHSQANQCVSVLFWISFTCSETVNGIFCLAFTGETRDWKCMKIESLLWADMMNHSWESCFIFQTYSSG